MKICLWFLLTLFWQVAATAQQPVDLLMTGDGRKITRPEQWTIHRRRLLSIAKEYVYGTIPPKPEHISVKTLSTRSVLGGDATESLFVLNIHRDSQTVPVRVGVIRPATGRPCPVFVKNDRWLFDLSAMPSGRKRQQYEEQKREQTLQEVRKLLIAHGYGVCKFVREDLAVDAPSCRQSGVLAMYPEYDWGAIAAWAWGYQPVIDHLLAAYNIDAKRIIATGHSRGGKTALAAAIVDDRIAIAAPSASGSGGTGSMQHFTPGGRQQTPQLLATNHSFWFSPHLDNLDPRQSLPIDGHTLLALVAPRGVINTHGADDPLANPLGTRMMFEASAPVFQMLGASTAAATHWRSGGHGHTVEDWKAMLDYAEAYFAKRELPRRFNNWPK